MIGPLFSLLIVLVLVYACYASGVAKSEAVFRLHIIANSDSFEDQRVKLLVRDALLAAESSALAKAGSKEGARRFLMGDAEEILRVVNCTLEENGASYGAVLHMGSYAFPDREYNKVVYPQDRYDALRIVLGNGDGQNWWCVMFPPLCISGPEEGEIDDEGIGFKSLIAEWIKGIDGGFPWRTEKDGS